jgi:hypothetical protein
LEVKKTKKKQSASYLEPPDKSAIRKLVSELREKAAALSIFIFSFLPLWPNA